MNPVATLENNINSRYVAETDDERRIRRGMRLSAKTWSKKTTRALQPAIIRGTALVAGGFCLGWKAFRFWRG